MKLDNPDYSVVIPSFRRPLLLARALDSVAKQTISPVVVHLIIDEPEGDCDYEFLKRYDLKLDILFTGGGLGGSGARNVGLDRASSDVVFFLDDDDAWYPTKIECQLEVLISSSDYIGVTCGRRIIGESGQPIDSYVPKERKLNDNINIRNITGSFSFFGFVRNERTASLRLEEGMPLAQDMEFYISISHYGRIGVAEEVLADYHAHAGPRISGSAEREVVGYKTLYHKHKTNMTLRERLWLLGSIRLAASKKDCILLAKLGYFATGATLMLASMKNTPNTALKLIKHFQ